MCPLCGQRPRTVIRSRREIEAELARRARLSRAALRDVTEATLGAPADILRCERCGVLIRDAAPGDDVFREDRYSARVLRTLHAVHAEAFRRKARRYRWLLPRRARVVEIGSYAGGFLRAAAEWGWRAAGIDIGGDTSRFTRALGFEMRDEIGACDAVFVWNCFEQVSAPRELLRGVASALTDGGVLVVRVPDAAFYMTAHDPSLLGWPHRYGYDLRALARLGAEYRFALRRTLRCPVIWPLPDPLAPRGWIELTFRKTAAARSRSACFEHGERRAREIRSARRRPESAARE